MTVVEKAAYLKGLAEGLGVGTDSKESKIWNGLMELVADMAHEIEELQRSDQDFADALDEISEDLTYLEDLTGSLDLPGDMERLEDCSGCLGCFRDAGDKDEDEDEGELVAAADYDGVIYDVTCPTCGRELSFDEETLEKGSIACPYCGEELEFDLDEPEDKE